MKTIISKYDYNKDGFYFYDQVSLKPIKEIFEINNIETLNGIPHHIYNNYYYSFPNPQIIKFIFPNSEEKEIFVANTLHISKIDELYPNYNIVGKTGEDKEFEEIISDPYQKYVEIKLESKYEDEKEFNKANSFFNISDNFPLSELSPVYDEYLDIPIVMDYNPTFCLTQDRKYFFDYMQKELKSNNFICICGPEGIGKSASILAFFKKNLSLYSYFYLNIRKLNELYEIKDTNNIQKLVLKELYHCIPIKTFSRNLNSLIDICKKNLNPFDLIIEILNSLKIGNINLIIDQYKTLYDNNYEKIKEIVYLINKYKIKIILISSINEEDVKDSIVSVIKRINITNKFILNYIYVTSLATCSEEDISKLDDVEKNILNKYGNTYYSYYRIIEARNNYKEEGENIDFEEYFDNKMYFYFKNRLKSYYINTKHYLNNIKYLLYLSETSISIQNFIDNSISIPFRFFKFKYQNENIFKIKSINLSDQITLSFQCEKYISFLLREYKRLFQEYDNNNISKTNFISNKEAISLEESFSLYLWASRKSNDRILKDINICRIVQIKNFFNLVSKDIDLTGLNEGDAILIDLIDQNAIAFDCGILKFENKTKNKFVLYLFQVTRNKKANERLTYISLNEYCSFLAIYFGDIFKISVEKTYFAYIFDKEFPDVATINECEENGIDYVLFDKKTLNLKRKLNLNQYKTKIKVYTSFPNISSIKEKKCFMNIEKKKDGDYNFGLSYLKKKRKIIEEMAEAESKLNHLETEKKRNKREKNETKAKNKIGEKNNNINKLDQNEIKEIEEIQNRISKVREYYSKMINNYANKKNDGKLYFMNYDEREKIISDYLIEKEKNNIPGISYKIEKQNKYIKFLQDKGFQEKEIKNLFNFIIKNKNDFIIELNELDSELFVPKYYFPDYNTYIFGKIGNIGYLIDYCEGKTIDLNNNNEMAYGYLDELGRNKKYYSISLISNSINNEEILNYLEYK